MVLFWLFFVLVLVLVLVLDRSIMRLYHSILVNALLRREFGNGLADGDKEPDPRVGERRFVGRNASRVDAMHAKRSITSTSTVRHGGLSTSTMGSCGRVGRCCFSTSNWKGTTGYTLLLSNAFLVYAVPPPAATMPQAPGWLARFAS